MLRTRPWAMRVGAIAHNRAATSPSSPAASAWPTASSSRPSRSCHAAARRCRSAVRSGSRRRCSARSISASSGWWRNSSSVRSSGTSGMPARESSRSIVPEPAVPRQPVAGRARQPREDRGAQQERDGGQGERGQDLVAQVVGHQPVVAGEGGDGRAAIVAAPDRERGDVERGGPALRALQQRGEIGGLELDPRHAQHRRRLPARHRELGGAQLDHEPLRAQGAERQRRLAPGGDRQLRSRGQLARPRLELDGPRLDVGAVDDGHGGRRRRVEGHGRALERSGPWRDPGERPVVALGPLAEQRRLAVARRRADDDERRVARLQQRADEPVAAHRAAAEAGAPAGEGDGRRRRWEGEGRSGAHASQHSWAGAAWRGGTPEKAREAHGGAGGGARTPAARLSSPCRSSPACGRSRAARPCGRASRTPGRDVVGERAGERVAEGELDERAHDRHVLGVGRQRVGGDHPAALGGELRRDVELVVVVVARSSWKATSGSCSASGSPIRRNSPMPAIRSASDAGVGLHRLHDVAVAVVAEADEVVVLGEHHRRAGREVQRERRVGLAEVVLVEDEILGRGRSSPRKISQPMPG